MSTGKQRLPQATRDYWLKLQSFKVYLKRLHMNLIFISLFCTRKVGYDTTTTVQTQKDFYVYPITIAQTEEI